MPCQPQLLILYITLAYIYTNYNRECIHISRSTDSVKHSSALALFSKFFKATNLI